MVLENQGDIESPDDRRKAARAVTFRSSSFTELTGEPRLCQGRVVDVSPSGFQMRSRIAPPIGSVLELEIAPREDDDRGETLVTCAKVVWTNPLSTGDVAMGLQNVDPEVLAAMVGPGRARQVEQGVLAPGDALARAVEDQGYFSFREDARDRLRARRRIWPYIVSLALLLLMLWFLLMAGPSAGQDGAAPFRHGLPGPEELLVTDEALHGQGGLEQVVDSETLERWLERGFDLLHLGQPREAADLFTVLLASGLVEGAAGVQALAGAVNALGVLGEAAERAALLARHDGMIATAPPVWQERIAAIRQSRVAGPRHQMTPAFLLEATADASEAVFEAPVIDGAVTPAITAEADAWEPQAVPGSFGATGAAIHLEIVLSERVLRVLEGETVRAEFPVGTGGFARTPQGVFTIVNRIENPDWYNRGQVVPAGDADNPLGSRWMGLAADGAAIPYGIHGTSDPASVGGEDSQGCIRMYADDVERLFDWCAVGARVHIRP